jgi:large subunit ribosomal protein L17
MRHKVAGRRLDRPTAQRLALYRNLVTSLLRHERLVTTEAKAKEIRGFAERVITLGKRGDLHARRQALAFLYDKNLVDKVFHELAPRYKDRPGGYVRLAHLGQRKGDAAPVAQIELLPAPEVREEPKK